VGFVAGAATNRFATLFDRFVRGYFFNSESRLVVHHDLATRRHLNASRGPEWITTGLFPLSRGVARRSRTAGIAVLEFVGLENLPRGLPLDDTTNPSPTIARSFSKSRSRGTRARPLSDWTLFPFGRLTVANAFGSLGGTFGGVVERDIVSSHE
jgi:hypothetical protein